MNARIPCRRGRLERWSAAALLALAALASGCAPKAPAAVERVILIGIDGMDWRVVDALVAEGRMPNVARFVAGGTAGEVTTLKPTYSPLIWASVATGKLPPKHGITGFGRRDPKRPDRIVPYTANARTSAALWEILGDAGKEVGVVGWWTTWPAEPVNGVMVSDRMLYNRFNVWHGLEHSGDDLPAQTYPPELFETLAPLTRMGEGANPDFIARFSSGRGPSAIDETLHDPWYELFLAFRRDEAYGAMLEAVLADHEPEFLAYYLNGPDIASHYSARAGGRRLRRHSHVRPRLRHGRTQRQPARVRHALPRGASRHHRDRRGTCSGR
jgi:hypothetical protein